MFGKDHPIYHEPMPPAFPTSTFQRSNSGEYVRQSVGDAKRKENRESNKGSFEIFAGFILAWLTAMYAFMALLASTVFIPQVWPVCESMEDPNPPICYWDAQVQGNGEGDSFLFFNGPLGYMVVYTP